MLLTFGQAFDVARSESAKPYFMRYLDNSASAAKCVSLAPSGAAIIKNKSIS